MSSTARHTLRATAAVTGLAALGVGLAGSAFAEEGQAKSGEGFQGLSLDAASVDGFDTDSMVPANAVMSDLAGTIAGVGGGRSAPTAGPTDSLIVESPFEAFAFEMPPTQFNSAAGDLRTPTAGEQEFQDMGMSPMMTPVMEHALPAILGGQRVSTADEAETFGQDNGLPEPVNGPGNEAAGPVTGSVFPAMAMMLGAVSDSTTNDDTTSNHEFSL